MDFVIKNDVLISCKNMKRSTKVEIPWGVKEIGPGALRGCRYIETVVIPDTVTKIGKEAFKDCHRLITVYYSESLKVIGHSAFEDCRNLNMRLKEGITTIGDFAFSGCPKQYFLIPDSVTSLGEYNFGYLKYPSVDRICELMFNGHHIDHNEYKMLCLNKTNNYYLNMAALILTHYGTAYCAHIIEELMGCLDKVMLSMVDILSGIKINSAICKNALTFMNSFKNSIPTNVVNKLTDVILRSNYSELLDPYIEYVHFAMMNPSDELQIFGGTGHPVEKYCLDRMSELTLFELFMDASDFDLDKARYISESKRKVKVPEYIVKCALFGFVCGSKAYRNREISPLEFSEKVASYIDPQSMSAVVQSHFDLHKLEDTDYYELYVRFGSSTLLSKMVTIVSSSDFHSIYRDLAYEALAKSNNRIALLALERAGLLYKAAAFQNIPEDELRNKCLYDFGFDCNGVKTYDIGGPVVKVVLNDDFTITLTDNDGNCLKTILKKGADSHKVDKAREDVSDLKKNIKKVAKEHTKTLLGKYVMSTVQSGDTWRKLYEENPVLRKVASLLVWEIISNKGSVYFVPTMDGRYIDENGSYINPPQFCMIRIAHPCEMDDDRLNRWKTYLTANHISQPFTQIFEPVYDLEYANLATRYKGVTVMHYQITSLLSEGSMGDYTIVLYGIKLKYFIENRRLISDWSTARGELRELSGFEGAKKRTINHVVYLIDGLCLYGAAKLDRVDLLVAASSGISEKNIQKLIKASIDTSSTNATAWLLDYKAQHFGNSDLWDDLNL